MIRDSSEGRWWVGVRRDAVEVELSWESKERKMEFIFEQATRVKV